MKKLLLSVLGMGLCATAGFAEGVGDRLKAAATVLTEIMSAPDKGIPNDVLDKADCVAIIPGMKKGGFIVGGRYGKGMVSCRNKAQTAWEAPVMLTLEGGSFGLQIGAQSTDFILLFMNDGGMNSLLSSKFEMGGDASVAAGPVGRQAGASTDLKLDAQILSYSRSKGLFAGLELKGTVISIDKDDMKEAYGDENAASGVLKGTKPPPVPIKVYPDTLARYSKAARVTATAKGKKR